MKKERVDTLILNGEVFTMEGEGVGYRENAGLALAGGEIVAVDRCDKLLEAYEAAEVIDAADKMVLPGFVDAHIHTSQTMMRGMAQDTKHWMMRGIEPLRYYVTPELTLESGQATVLEALAAGTTTFGEYAGPDHLDLVDEFYHDLGVRTNYAMVIYGMRKQEDANPEDLYDLDEAQAEYALGKNIALHEKWKSRSSRTTVNIGAHAPDTLSREMLHKCKRAATDLGIKINMHVAQGDREIYQVEKRHGMRSIPFLQSLGYLDESLIAVHLTEATDDEARLVAKSGASMVVCSGSIGIIDGIVPPAAVFQQAGGSVGLGTDQASGNNCNQMINEMKLTALFNKIKYRDPEAMPSWRVLRMATIEGARALGLDKTIGSLEKGKRADIVFVDLARVTMMPVIKRPYRNLVPNLVHAARGDEVCRVMVDGKTLYRDGKYLTVDAGRIINTFRNKAKDFYENTPWGEPVKKTTGYRLQEKGLL